ncbi:MAG: septal ring lytic transglycosylase RlpA family protein [Balneolaceae bacterium]
MTFIHRNVTVFLLLVFSGLTASCQVVGDNDIRDGEFIEFGIASWYGDDFHGKPTASGETYDMEEMTAAHKTLPFNSVVRVKNRDNGKSVIVRINDRGPFVEGRVIDLSQKAAREIGIIDVGLARAELYLLAD